MTSSIGTLFVVATPIGNLEDLTLRAVRILNDTSVIAAEDTRITAKLLSHAGISTSMMSIRGGKASRHVDTLLRRLMSGEDVALVSDAGTPSVSDPGYELVTAAHEAGVKVSPIPGPSALASAISAAGLRGEGVRFLGFLPRTGRRRKALLASLETERAMSVIYESPRRVGATLTDLFDSVGDRTATVLRELTKVHEEIVRGPLSVLKETFRNGRGEFTIAIEGVLDDDAVAALSDVELEEMVVNSLAAGKTVKDVAQSLSSGFGLSRKRVYQIALEIQLRRM